MKLAKYLTRAYTLSMHSLIVEALLKRNSTFKGIYYNKEIDISVNGIIDAYVLIKDMERNFRWVEEQVKKDKQFIKISCERGLKVTKELLELPEDLPEKIKNLKEEEVFQEIGKLRRKFFGFSGQLEFTHCLGRSKVKLSEKELGELSLFHEIKKNAYTNFFKFYNKVLEKIAEKYKVKAKNLDNISSFELIRFLKGEIDVEEINKRQKQRKNRYISLVAANYDEVIDTDFDKECEKIKKDIIEEKLSYELKGTPIYEGIVNGKVIIITQKTPLNNIPLDKIIVTQMSNPSMTPVMKKAKAIVTDEGGLLSHAAHVAREFKIPCVIGTGVATKVFKNGDTLQVNANKGIVRKIK